MLDREQLTWVDVHTRLPAHQGRDQRRGTLAATNGAVFEVGDTDEFSTMSVSKRLVFALICQELGRRGLVESRDDGTRINARVRTPEGAEADCQASYIVCCDGARSTLGQQIGASFRGTARFFMSPTSK